LHIQAWTYTIRPQSWFDPIAAI